MYINKYKKTISLIDEMFSILTDNENLDEKEEFKLSLKNIKHILSQKIFKVAVVGAIKSGKSTTLNAFIGRDLLPNQNAPCTVATTEIFHSNNECTYIRKFFNNGEFEDIRVNKNSTLEEMFHKDIKDIRNTNSHSEIQKYTLSTPINGLKTSNYGEIINNFVLLDTPGPDEISTKDFDVEHLQKVSLKEFKDSDALVVLFDYQNFMSDINGKMLKYISSNVNITKNAKNNMFFIINKIDLINSKDDSIEECIRKTKKMIREYVPEIDEPNVYTFSAKKALLARIVKENNATQDILNEIDRLYGSDYTEEIELNGVKRKFKLEPKNYADKLLEESGIKDIENEILNGIFSNFAEEKLEIVIEKLEGINNDIINNLTNDIDSINNRFNLSIEKLQILKDEMINLKKDFSEVLDIPKKCLNILKNSIECNLNEMSNYLDDIVNEMLPVKNIVESDTKEDLIHKINGIENNIKESLNLSINKINDHIYNESFNTQIEINKNLNDSFRDIGDQFNKYINEQIKFKFQIYNFDDICISNINFNEFDITEKQSTIKEFDNIKTSTFTIGMAATSVAGSALGGMMGRTVPLFETAIGAAFGAGIGFAYLYVKKIKNTRIKEKTIYSVDVKDFKDNFLNTVREVFENTKIEIFNNVDALIEKSACNVDKQLSKYLSKLDNKIGRLIKNMKIDKEKKKKAVKNSQILKNEFIRLSKEINEIKFKMIYIGNKEIELNNKTSEELKHDNILII